jgi:hypothetical protein
MLWAVKTLPPFMTNECKTRIFTDCKAVFDIVQGLGSYDKLLTTWGLIISSFPVEVCWIRGVDNLADQPSRDIFAIEEEDEDTFLYEALKSNGAIPNQRKWKAKSRRHKLVDTTLYRGFGYLFLPNLTRLILLGGPTHEAAIQASFVMPIAEICPFVNVTESLFKSEYLIIYSC